MRRVVITGMGAITPVGQNVDALWDSVVNGKCGIAPITKFDTTDYKAKLAAEVKGFDPSEHGIDKTTARRSDLYAQYALAAARQAMELSGLSGMIESERLGVYVGSGMGGMHTFVTELEKLNAKGPSRVSPFFVPMLIGNIAAGSIAIEHRAEGPCLPVVTACATSTHAIGEAYNAIRLGLADAIIAGGSEATIEPIAVAGFISCMALSLSDDPTRASLPFDKRREGFVMGEGSGILILEEYEHAVNRGATIYAELCGYANTCDAFHITAPNPEAKQSASSIRMTAEQAGISPSDCVYINAHGTGTPLNDKIETLAIKNALGEEMARQALISSTKSVTGHMLGAAGAVEAIVTILSLKNGIAPPTIGLDEPDPECDLDYVPGTARKAPITVALSTSLGFGGHNGCLAFRAAPEKRG